LLISKISINLKNVILAIALNVLITFYERSFAIFFIIFLSGFKEAYIVSHFSNLKLDLDVFSSLELAVGYS
jgi:hypothetical protein